MLADTQREWTFQVSCCTQSGEVVCVSGSCESLGCWNHNKLVQLVPHGTSDDEPIVWSATLRIPCHEVEYRFCVCIVVEPRASEPDVPGYLSEVFAIKRWETSLLPRKIQSEDSNISCPEIDCFGYRDSFERVDQGWLTYDTVVQLKLCPSAIHNPPLVLWKRKHRNKKCFVKVTPIEIEKHDSLEPIAAFEMDESTEFDISDLRSKMYHRWPIVEVAIMKEEDSRFHLQDQFGTECDGSSFIVLQCRMLGFQSIAFLLDVYVEGLGCDSPRYIGHAFVLSSNLKENLGVATLPITSPHHSPIGQLTVHYLVVKPMRDYKCDLSVSYARYWKDSWKGLEVGHRGAGNSYHPQTKCCSNIRENSLASLKHAAENGADMVEFDVQLSRDKIPVLNHDYHVCIALKKKKGGDLDSLLEIPVKDLTLQQLQALKLYHRSENGSSWFSDEELEDHQPFPTLQRAFEFVPTSCGFNVEIKWTMQLQNGTYTLQHPFELNDFLDTIIKVVLENAGKRKIVFSCFHPDICTMVRLKQNRYPVLFLTQGKTSKYPPYDDPRTNSIPNAVSYAMNADILGINIHTEDILENPEGIKQLLTSGLVVFCWGDSNNNETVIKSLKKLGIHGIIYDKLGEYNTKETKESIFLCEENEASAMLKAASDSAPKPLNFSGILKTKELQENLESLSEVRDSDLFSLTLPSAS